MAGKLVQLTPGTTPVWDVAGDYNPVTGGGGSQGFIAAVAVIPAGSGKLVIKKGTVTPVWDVAGDYNATTDTGGSQGFIEAVASIS